MHNGADAQRNVNSVLDDIDATVGRIYAQLNVRKLALERAKQFPPGFEPSWQRQAQTASEAGLVASHGFLAVGQRINATDCMFVKPSAGIGQPRATHRAFEQLYFEFALQFAKATAERRQRNPHS